MGVILFNIVVQQKGLKFNHDSIVRFTSHNSLKGLMSMSYVSQISVSLASAFGKQTDCAKWIVDFILNKIESNFRLFGADCRVTENTCKLLLSLVSSRDK